MFFGNHEKGGGVMANGRSHMAGGTCRRGAPAYHPERCIHGCGSHAASTPILSCRAVIALSSEGLRRACK